MGNLEDEVKALSRTKSSRGIAKELGLSRTKVDEILQSYRNRRLRRLKLAAIIGAVALPLAIGGGYFLRKADVPQYSGSTSSEGWRSKSERLLTRYLEIQKRLEDPIDFLGKRIPRETFKREFDDPEKFSLYKKYDEYLDHPSGRSLDNLIALFESKPKVVSASSFLSDDLNLLRMTKRINGAYDLEKERFTSFLDTNWKTIYN